MTRKILFVDDEENVLSAYTRVLRKRFQIETATGGEEALLRLEGSGPYAVIVSDMRMPRMDGVQLLSKVKELAPETVRIMLTGNADQQTATDAVNRGAIFRFLTKPCDAETLGQVLDAALDQYALVRAEKELLEQTLTGAISMMVELLSMLDPTSFGRSQRLAEITEQVAKDLGMEDPWMMGVASVLSQIGVLMVPPQVLEKVRRGAILTSAEREMYARVPEIGSNLIRKIPRLEEVANIVYYAQKNFNGSGFPQDNVKEEEIPLGSRILRAVGDYLDLLLKLPGPLHAVQDMFGRTAWYDIRVLHALQNVLEAEVETGDKEPAFLTVSELQAGLVVLENVETLTGWLIIPKGTLLRAAHLEKLRNFTTLAGVKEPIAVAPPEA
nr:HD domain-containing phosphohydrolase [uncultured Holophaga sp.]